MNLTDTALSEKSIYYKVHKYAKRTMYHRGKHTYAANPTGKGRDERQTSGEREGGEGDQGGVGLGEGVLAVLVMLFVLKLRGGYTDAHCIIFL